MKLNSVIGGAILFSALLLSACATTATGLGDDVGPTRLPTGLTLMEAHERECEGTLHMGELSALSWGLEEEFFVDPGENATFMLVDDEVEWACIRHDSRDFGAVDCPRYATHVRITRAAYGGGLLLECYG